MELDGGAWEYATSGLPGAGVMLRHAAALVALATVVKGQDVVQCTNWAGQVRRQRARAFGAAA
jgi:hypothetical protein